MIGIYQDKFVDYLRDNLGDPIKITSKNIVVRCPWCEYGKEKDHYHMYISLEAPIFHCFHANCEQSGILGKLLRKIQGHDISSKFVDRKKISEISKKRVFVRDEDLKNVIIPDLKEDVFPNKALYIRKRLKFANISLKRIKGLIFDVYEFIDKNRIPVRESLFRTKDYLHSNFVGFVTNHGSTVIFRNIDNSHSMRFYKLKVQDSSFVDYYRLPGNNIESKKIVLAEGIFDIFSEQIYDNLNIKHEVKLYASVLSSKYASLIQSIVYHEQIFRPDIIILSDNGIDLGEYKKLKKFNSHIINTLSVYYNKAGKDFNDTPVIPNKFVIH
jgi:hypothetical protein